MHKIHILLVIFCITPLLSAMEEPEDKAISRTKTGPVEWDDQANEWKQKELSFVEIRGSWDKEKKQEKKTTCMSHDIVYDFQDKKTLGQWRLPVIFSTVAEFEESTAFKTKFNTCSNAYTQKELIRDEIELGLYANPLNFDKIDYAFEQSPLLTLRAMRPVRKGMKMKVSSDELRTICCTQNMLELVQMLQRVIKRNPQQYLTKLIPYEYPTQFAFHLALIRLQNINNDNISNGLDTRDLIQRLEIIYPPAVKEKFDEEIKKVGEVFNSISNNVSHNEHIVVEQITPD